LLSRSMPRPLRAACTPTTLTFNLEEKSMKKLYALLVVAGLCATILFTSPVR